MKDILKWHRQNPLFKLNYKELKTFKRGFRNDLQWFLYFL